MIGNLALESEVNGNMTVFAARRIKACNIWLGAYERHRREAPMKRERPSRFR